MDVVLGRVTVPLNVGPDNLAIEVSMYNSLITDAVHVPAVIVPTVCIKVDPVQADSDILSTKSKDNAVFIPG